jgi:hypothetical protein
MIRKLKWSYRALPLRGHSEFCAQLHDNSLVVEVLTGCGTLPSTAVVRVNGSVIGFITSGRA